MTKETVLVQEPEMEIAAVLIALNDGSEIRRLEMRRLVGAWESAERNIQAMREKFADIATDLSPYLDFRGSKPSWWAVPFEAGSGLRVLISPESNKQSFTREELLKDEPRLMFMRFLMNPLRETLSEGPCRRCNRYFVKKRSNHKSYCNRKCGTFVSARAATRRRSDAERVAKLAQASALIGEWNRLKRRPRTSWKEWIAKRNPQFSSKWLTRAVNQYGLTPPTLRSEGPNLEGV